MFIELGRRRLVDTPRKVAARSVLLVEDNVLIAIDAEDMLRSLGFQEVYIATSLDEALALLDAHQIDVGVLDIAIGDNSSVELARVMQTQSIPFFFVSGYVDRKTLAGEFNGTPKLDKPYTEEALADALAKLGFELP